MKSMLISLFAVLLLGLGALALQAQPSHTPTSTAPIGKLPVLLQTSTSTPVAATPVGILTADPTNVFVGSSTVVTLTCELTDPRVIPTSVNVQQLDSSGNPLTVVGSMTRSSSKPTFYSFQLTLNPSSPQVLYYRASVAYSGTLQRQYSRMLTVTATSVDTAGWLTYATHSGYHFSYPANWTVSEADDGTITLSPPDTSQTIPIEQAAAITINYENNPSGLTISQYFDGQFGPDLFTGTSAISTTTVSSIQATEFVGLTTVPSDEAIVVPLSRAFLVVLASVPDQMLTPFLNSISIPIP
jgi:hypothetical protein